jgi:hypothetical protein
MFSGRARQLPVRGRERAAADTPENARIPQGKVFGVEREARFAALAVHLADPATTVMGKLLVQCWRTKA